MQSILSREKQRITEFIKRRECRIKSVTSIDPGGWHGTAAAPPTTTTSTASTYRYHTDKWRSRRHQSLKQESCNGTSGIYNPWPCKKNSQFSKETKSLSLSLVRKNREQKNFQEVGERLENYSKTGRRRTERTEIPYRSWCIALLSKSIEFLEHTFLFCRFEDEENFHCISGKESTRGIDIFLFLWSLDNRYIIVFLPNVIVITIAGEDTVDKF